jgi:carbonic anhydrase
MQITASKEFSSSSSHHHRLASLSHRLRNRRIEDQALVEKDSTKQSTIYISIASVLRTAMMAPICSQLTTTRSITAAATALFFFLLGTTSCYAQPNNNDNDGTDSLWQDSYRLEYTYDALDDRNGPASWQDVTATTEGWGEWEHVNGNNGLIDFTANECGIEARPSPIEIIPSSTCQDSQEMRVRQFNDQWDCRHPLEEERDEEDDEDSTTSPVTDPWEITPYSLRWYFPRNDRVCRRPTLRLDNIFAYNDRRNDEHFVLLWLELHARSEHVIQGKRYDAELQMVHMATTRPNELLIVTVLIEASAVDDHEDFQAFLLDGWQRKAMEEATTCAGRKKRLRRSRRHLQGEWRKSSNAYWTTLQDYNQSHASAHNYHDNEKQEAASERKLQGGRQNCVLDQYGNGCESMGLRPRKRFFPYNLWPSLWYFSYVGSLTAPPCTGKVHWRIIDTPL